MLILDLHELTIEAIMRQDRGLLVRALAMDPLVNSISTAEAVISEIAEAESDILKWKPVATTPKKAPAPATKFARDAVQNF